MKRYLDIENNIITFIEDYNRNYRYNQYQPQTLGGRRANKPSSENFVRLIRHSSIESPYPNRISIVGSSNSINSSVQLTHRANLRRHKSESDLFNILQSKNYRYFTDEVFINDDSNTQETGYLEFVFQLPGPNISQLSVFAIWAWMNVFKKSIIWFGGL